MVFHDMDPLPQGQANTVALDREDFCQNGRPSRTGHTIRFIHEALATPLLPMVTGSGQTVVRPREGHHPPHCCLIARKPSSTVMGVVCNNALIFALFKEQSGGRGVVEPTAAISMGFRYR
jgi:hypothetical protein